jgi:hypothetical protein
MPSSVPPGLTLFRDDDRAFFDWLDQHPDAYFINMKRNPPNLILHHSGCSNFDRSPQVSWTNTVKVCSTDRGALENWARTAVDGDLTRCRSRSCFG